MPGPSRYGDSDKFIHDAMVYIYPRGCIYYTTADGVRDSDDKKPGKFSINSIIENKHKDGWYVGYMTPVHAFYGSGMAFYFNKNNGDWSCGGRKTRQKATISFVPGRWLNLESLSAGTSSAPRETSSSSSIEAKREEQNDRPLANKPKSDICHGLKNGNPDFIEEAKHRGLTEKNCTNLN